MRKTLEKKKKMSARTWIVAIFVACVAVASVGVAQAEQGTWYDLLGRVPARPGLMAMVSGPQMLAHSSSDSSSDSLSAEEVAAMAVEAEAARQAALSGPAGWVLNRPGAPAPIAIPDTSLGGSATVGYGNCVTGDLLCYRGQSSVVSQPEPAVMVMEEPEGMVLILIDDGPSFGNGFTFMSADSLLQGGSLSARRPFQLRG